MHVVETLVSEDEDEDGFDVWWICAFTVKRSYLGTSLQDDVENEKEMLQQQRAEVAELREQLQKQVRVVPFCKILDSLPMHAIIFPYLGCDVAEKWKQ